MALIPSESIEDIRSRLDLVELVGEYVPQLQRAGRNMKGRCPFHQERTPSFIVSPERQTYHCFGCGEGGDVFAFLMKIESLSFSEAVERLAQRTGVALARQEPGPAERESLRLKELLAFAAEFYHGVLARGQEAEAARRYLAGRGVESESWKSFQLGYAPGSEALGAAAVRKGFPKELLAKAGLSGTRGRDYFFGRLLFPIRDAKGAVVAFGGRTLGEAQPKYLNSPESPVFSKGRVLYGLWEGLSEVRKARRVVLMEGYMDVIAAHRHGFPLASAPLGTALTQEQANLIKRYAGEALVVFDSDSAGFSAAVRGAEVLLAAGLEVRIASVPEGKDPDEHLQSHGVESFKACLAGASDLVEFKTELLLRRQAVPLSPQAKSAVAREVLETIRRSPDEILRDEWVRRLSQRLGVGEEALKRELAQERKSFPGRAASAAAPGAGQGEAEVPPAERQVLQLLFREPALAGLAREKDFESESGRRLWRALAAAKPEAADYSARLLERLEPAERALASAFLVAASGLDTSESIVRGALERLRTRQRLSELEKLSREDRLAEPGLEDEYLKLLTQSRRTGVH